MATWQGYLANTIGLFACTACVDVRVLLFESFGVFAPDVVQLLRDLADERQNRLNKAEYELTTWAARTWLSFSSQKLSVALHRATALEIAHALGISTGADER